MHPGPGSAAPPGAVQVSPRVWRVSLAGHRPFALKYASDGAPLVGELRHLRWLAQQGCAVARVLADAGGDAPEWLMLEWCGDETLDVVLQSARPRRAAALGVVLARAIVQIEAAFRPFTERIGADPGKRQALIEQALPWADAAPSALSWLLDGAQSEAMEQGLAAVVRLAFDATPDVGSLDYHAGNVVVRGRRLSIVDWSAVGLDWPDRRLVQYGTATGAGLAAGGFRSAITASAVRVYARLAAAQRGSEAADVAQIVDAHDVLLLLTAAQQLRLASEGEAVTERVAAWGDIPVRRAQLLALLRRRLVSTGPAEALRRLVRRR